MSTLELTILMGGFIHLSQQHFDSFTKLKDPKRLLQYGQCNFPLVQDSFKIQLSSFVFHTHIYAYFYKENILDQ